MAIDPALPIREIALAVPGARQVLDKAGLDYCCGGDASLAQACGVAGVSVKEMLASLDAASGSPENVAAFHDYRGEAPAAVAAHIVEHNYPVERVGMADTSELLSQVVSVHGAAHPELREVERLWGAVCRQLHAHMGQERHEIDPFVAKATTDFSAEHAELVALMRRVRAVTREFAPPDDACDALRAVYRDLEAFEADLHEHVLLADGVLFRRG